MEREAERARWWHTAHLRRDMRIAAGWREVPDPVDLHPMEEAEGKAGNRNIEGDITALKVLVGHH
jgi:hypothetical protein